jgi:ABC-type uncharacterized transport system substrate-binding protein
MRMTSAWASRSSGESPRSRTSCPLRCWNSSSLPSRSSPRTYGVDLNDNYRRAGAYVDRILKGEKPATMPVQQPTKFEVALNLRTARAMGLAIPHSVLVRADTIVE